MITTGLMSSNTDNWPTPKKLFDELNAEFNFNLDPCADDDNHKCPRYYTIKDNGLSKKWGAGDRVFMNPPYGREIGKWVKKARDSLEMVARVHRFRRLSLSGDCLKCR